MLTSKKFIILVMVILFSVVALLSGCVPREDKIKVRYNHYGNELMQTIVEKIKDGTLKDSLPPELEKALAERIRTAKLQDILPPTGVIIFGLLIPILCILAFLAFLILFMRFYHIRAMAMIEKGNYERKPLNIRWDLIFLFFGLLLTFLGPAISIYMISLFGFQSSTLTGGIIPLFIGFSLLVFYKMYINFKKNNTV